ncbi:expressed unknown protein [Seminavis robusta]|uniref:Uncharacterized protein n=1 Tax=Seminavis robusta TaxID=568900 RepID=A0A9N8E3Y6_9STRA|nr:expressed unknown protein [Seminavis robusta]|eukprot:Sro478_g150970.1 n/a (181) ;mRNA; f:14037-14705
MSSFQRSVTLVLLLLMISAHHVALGALPPWAVEEMKAEAQEVLLISVAAVDEIVSAGQDQCQTDYDITARVLSVNATQQLLTAQDTVAFASYVRDFQSPDCVGWVGPKLPPVLEPGWCGYVYLNKAEEAGNNNRFLLATYGDSFVALDTTICATILAEMDVGATQDSEESPSGDTTQEEL